MEVRMHVYFTGEVQEVGFRHRTFRIAVGLNIGGWVKNIPDGRVEMLAEGKESKILELIRQLELHFRIDKKEIRESAFEDEFPGFNIVR